MLRRVALVRTDVSEEHIISIIRVTGIVDLATANVVPSPLSFVTLMTEAIRYSETWILIRATRRNIPEDGILFRFMSLPLVSKCVC
jgi:hypothetical protein